MRVMCIKKNGWVHFDNRPSKTKDPVFGEICEVLKSAVFLGYTFYSIQGFKDKYNAKEFIPLSEIDETELVNERELQEA